MSLKLSPAELSYMWVAITDKVILAERMLLKAIRMPETKEEERTVLAENYRKLWLSYSEKQTELNRDYPPTRETSYPWNNHHDH